MNLDHAIGAVVLVTPGGIEERARLCTAWASVLRPVGDGRPSKPRLTRSAARRPRRDHGPGTARSSCRPPRSKSCPRPCTGSAMTHWLCQRLSSKTGKHRDCPDTILNQRENWKSFVRISRCVSTWRSVVYRPSRIGALTLEDAGAAEYTTIASAWTAAVHGLTRFRAIVAAVLTHVFDDLSK